MNNLNLVPVPVQATLRNDRLLCVPLGPCRPGATAVQNAKRPFTAPVVLGRRCSHGRPAGSAHVQQPPKARLKAPLAAPSRGRSVRLRLPPALTAGVWYTAAGVGHRRPNHPLRRKKRLATFRSGCARIARFRRPRAHWSARQPFCLASSGRRAGPPPENLRFGQQRHSSFGPWVERSLAQLRWVAEHVEHLVQIARHLECPPPGENVLPWPARAFRQLEECQVRQNSVPNGRPDLDGAPRPSGGPPCGREEETRRTLTKFDLVCPAHS